MTLKEAREIARIVRPYKTDLYLSESDKAVVVLDDRITELEEQLAKCQENKDKA